MKVGDLVKWAPDGDIGIIIGVVGDNGEGSSWDDDAEAGNPIISWFGLGCGTQRGRCCGCNVARRRSPVEAPREWLCHGNENVFGGYR